MIRRLANFVHNCVAHPALYWTGDHPAAVWLHDRTAEIAYPGRPIPARPGAPTDVEEPVTVADLLDRVLRAGCAAVAARAPAPYVIQGRGGPYLTRWTLLDRRPEACRLCLHFFHRSDEDLELHTHPWAWALGLQLAGGYLEERRVGDAVVAKTRRPGALVFLTAATAHRVDLLDPDRGSWSLFLVGPVAASWGFLDRETWSFTPWRDFIASKGLVPQQTPRRRRP